MFAIEGFYHGSAYVEYGPVSNSMSEAEDEIIDEPDTAPSDIASVSKFIKEFHVSPFAFNLIVSYKTYTVLCAIVVCYL